MSFAVTAVAMMGAGAVAGGIGAYYGAKSQKNQLQFQADMAERNAAMAERAAQSALVRGQQEEQGVRLRAGHLKSRQRVSMAANGIDLGSDTALNILTTTDTMSEIDALTAQSNALQAAWGYRTQGLNYEGEARMSRATASGISPNTAALSSLLGSGGQVAGSWYSLKKSGAFSNSPSNAPAQG